VTDSYDSTQNHAADHPCPSQNDTGNEEEVCEHRHEVAPIVVVGARERFVRRIADWLGSVFPCSVNGDPHWEAVEQDPNWQNGSELHLTVTVLEVFELEKVTH